MATTVTGKLNKAASQFQAGDSTGFGIRLGVKYYDRETKSDAWTNYEAVVFAKAPAQVKFYQEALVEGAIIEVSGDKCKIRLFQGNNGVIPSIEILDAKLGVVYAPQQAQQPAPAQRQQPAQPARQAPPQGYQAQYGNQPTAATGGVTQQNLGPMEPPIDFDDDIPF